MADRTTALVLFSGGQDSSTCLLWALHNYDYVETIGFDYGQTNRIELEARQNIFREIRRIVSGIAKKLGDDRVVQVPSLAQTTKSTLVNGPAHTRADGLPSSFVPGRNLLFFILAASLASERGITDLVGGMSEAEYSGYPDCREETLGSLENTIQLGINRVLRIVLPLIDLSKAQTWQLLNALGGKPYVQMLLEHSHTCYSSNRGRFHTWGYGCGHCPACKLRANGFEHFSTLAQQ